MTKIYTDTNCFLSFYQAADEGIDVFFGELQKFKSHLVLTEQTIMEFRRNRVGTLKRLRDSIKASCLPNTSIIQWLSGHKDVTDLPNTSDEKGQEVLQRLQEFIDDEKKDPVAQKLLALAADATVTNLKLTDQALDRAHRRKLLGNPPKTKDKYTVGDELNWELLLGNLDEDLIILTKDHTFKDNLSLLREEYGRRTGSTLLCVVETIGDAVTGIGQKPSKKLVKEEKKLPDFLKWVTKGSGRHAAILWQKVDRLIMDYAEENELETGDEWGDQRLVPIMRSLASLILKECDEIDEDIKRDYGIGTDEEA